MLLAYFAADELVDRGDVGEAPDRSSLTRRLVQPAGREMEKIEPPPGAGAQDS